MVGRKKILITGSSGMLGTELVENVRLVPELENLMFEVDEVDPSVNLLKGHGVFPWRSSVRKRAAHRLENECRTISHSREIANERSRGPGLAARPVKLAEEVVAYRTRLSECTAAGIPRRPCRIVNGGY